MNYSSEMYKRIVGTEPPKPFGQKTPEERLRDRDRFLEVVLSAPDDDAPDDFLKLTRMNPVFDRSALDAEEQVDAA